MKYELIEKHYQDNYPLLVKRTTWKVPNKSEALAEECVQEAYTRAMKYWNTFNPKQDSFEKWFAGILRNAINDCRTQEKDRGVSTEVTDEEEMPLTPSKKEKIVALFELRRISNLTTRRILSLFLLYGYKTRDISIYTGVAHGTVRQTIARWRDGMTK